MSSPLPFRLAVELLEARNTISNTLGALLADLSGGDSSDRFDTAFADATVRPTTFAPPPLN